MGSLRDREVACSASDRQGSNFESCVWRAVSSHLSHHPQEVLLAQFSLYVHKGGLKHHSFHFISYPYRAYSLIVQLDLSNLRESVTKGVLIWIKLIWVSLVYSSILGNWMNLTKMSYEIHNKSFNGTAFYAALSHFLSQKYFNCMTQNNIIKTLHIRGDTLICAYNESRTMDVQWNQLYYKSTKLNLFN